MRNAIVLLPLLATAPALAAEQPMVLKPGLGVETVTQACSGCHSLDYVRMNAPFLSADQWKAEIGKMRTAFGAGIDDADAATIQQYLIAQYGAK